MESAPVRYAVVDTETSGLSAERHRLLQVGVVVVDADGTVLHSWSSLVRPRRRWFYRVGPTHIHGIHRRDVRHAPPAADVLHQLAGVLEGARFVAHNSDFDVAFLTRAAAREGVVLPIVDPVCTLRLSRRLDPERQLSHRLGDVADRFGVALLRPHDALSDAEATAAILPHLLRAHAAVAAAAGEPVDGVLPVPVPVPVPVPAPRAMATPLASALPHGSAGQPSVVTPRA